MTVAAAPARLRRYCVQAVVVLLINVPTVSFGLSLGWVSLASGESGGEGGGADGELVMAVATTFLASLVGVPLSARALASGRKLAVIATSVAFLVCWALTLCGGGWWVVSARVAAGLGGAGAWAVGPLLAQEMCEEGLRGAAVAALVVAHNVGFLLMYLAAAAHMHHRTVVWCCLCVSALHCVVFLLVPESPAFLAANGRPEEARAALARLRGEAADSSALDSELAALPLPDLTVISPLQIAKDMLRDRCRRRAFIIAAIAVIGQELCGVLTLLQFAEHVFVLARDSPPLHLAAPAPLSAHPTHPANESQVSVLVAGGGVELSSPAGHAVLLGAVQLVASAFALYLVEKVGRRRLLVWSAVVTGLGLGGAACAAGRGAGGAWLAAALCVVLAADSAGLQPAPYALLADLFHYQYRTCAVSLVGAGACLANALEVLGFACVSSHGGLAPALALAAAITLALAAFSYCLVPETRGRDIDQVYRQLCAGRPCKTHSDGVTMGTKETCSKETVCTKV